MIEKIPDINDARWAWLNKRNPELMQECQWRIKRLLEIAEPAFIDWPCTEFFDVQFNNEEEKKVFLKYILGMGYTFEMKFFQMRIFLA